jgi:hypothetical protein
MGSFCNKLLNGAGKEALKRWHGMAPEKDLRSLTVERMQAIMDSLQFLILDTFRLCQPLFCEFILYLLS